MRRVIEFPSQGVLPAENDAVFVAGEHHRIHRECVRFLGPWAAGHYTAHPSRVLSSSLETDRGTKPRRCAAWPIAVCALRAVSRRETDRYNGNTIDTKGGRGPLGAGIAFVRG
jgi:hypothetical protein